MLVLTRKVEEVIVINGNIYVKILGVERDRVKIGIAAPKEVPILRGEILERDNQKPDVFDGLDEGLQRVERVRGDEPDRLPPTWGKHADR